MASQITSLTIVYSTFYSGTDPWKHQNSASLAFVRGIHRWPMTRTNGQKRGKCSHWWRLYKDSFAQILVLMIQLCHRLYLSHQLRCRGMCKIVTWSSNYFARTTNIYFYLEYELKNQLQNGRQIDRHIFGIGKKIPVDLMISFIQFNQRRFDNDGISYELC